MSKKLIALSASMGSGKTTALEIIRKLVTSSSDDVFFRKIRFSAALYKLQFTVYDALGIPHDNTLKDGKLLQVLGTDWGRNYDENIWVNQFEREFKGVDFVPNNVVFVCDDCRFDNEAAKVKELGGTIIKLVRPQYLIPESIVKGRDVKHASEAGIEWKYVDYTIINDLSLENLEENLKQILLEIGAI